MKDQNKVSQYQVNTEGGAISSGAGKSGNKTMRPPKWCIPMLGGCWVLGLALLATNVVTLSGVETENESKAYQCGDEEVSQTSSTTATTKLNAAQMVELGKTTYGTYCVACHQVGAIGKVGFAPALMNADFLALSSDDFIRTTIKKGRPGTSMTAWAMLSDQHVDGIIAYLRSAKGRTLVKEKVDDTLKFSGDSKLGKPLYDVYCGTCHGEKGIGYLSGSSGPGIGLKGFLDTACDDYIYKTMKYGRAGTPMRPMIGAVGLANLDEKEAKDIIAYLRSLQGGDKATKVEPLKPLAKGDAKVGEQQYTMNCQACHQKDGIGKPGFAPSIRNRDFLAIASDHFIRESIGKGRPGTSMMARPDISKENVNHIIAYLRAVPDPNPIEIKVDNTLKIRGDAKHGETKFTTYCATCHGNKGVGYIAGVAGPAIGLSGFLNLASDDYIFQTVKHGRLGTAMKPFMGPEGVANLNKDDVADIISYLRSLNKK